MTTNATTASKDTITLPREVVEKALKALEDSVDCVLASAAAPRGLRKRGSEAITALRTHLAAEHPKQEPVAWMDRFGSVVLGKGPYETFTTPLYTAPSALAAEQPKPSEDIEALRRENERLRELLNRLEYDSEGYIQRYPEEEEVKDALRREVYPGE